MGRRLFHAPHAAALLLAGLTVLGAAVGSSFAAFHLMVIQEVFVGPPGDGALAVPPLTADQRAQYVMLRMTSSGQNFTNGTSLRVEDANGNLLGNFATLSGVANGGGACSYPNCPALVAGTQAAKNLFTFAFDKIVDGQAGRVALPLSGGRVCFVSGSSVVDCVAWGNFDCTRSAHCALPNGPRSSDATANGCDLDFGAPAPALKYGFVLRHNAGFSCAAKTSSTDYSSAFPRPVNNAGASDNSDSDGDGLINQLDCNDASATILWPGIEVQNERVMGRPTSTISWDSQAATAGSGVTYDVICGTVSHVNGFTDAICLAGNITGNSIIDGAVPTPGDALYFVERAGTGAGCVGTYGKGFNPATSRDPVLGPKCP